MTDLDALARIRASWGEWSTFARQATDRWASRIEAEWTELRGRVDAFLDNLREAQRAINALPAKIGEYLALGGNGEHAKVLQRNHAILVERWTILVAGLHQDARPAPTDGDPRAELGAAPLLVVAGIVISIAGIAFALAAYEYAASLRTEADAQLREIDGRIEAMRAGKKLQESTYKPPERPSSFPWGLLLGGALVGGALWYTSRGTTR